MEMSENTCKTWRPSPTHPQNYEVSDMGDVRNKITGRILKPATDKYGYLYCVLCHNGNRRTVKAHRLVALAFIPNPDNKPTVDHINGDRVDNRVGNLRWATNKEQTNNPNTLPNVLRALGERDHRADGAKRDFGRCMTEVSKGGNVVGCFKSQKDAAKFAGVSEGKVSMCVNGKKEQVSGYSFKRTEGDVRDYY